MADHGTPHFQNDQGAPSIEIGAKKFMCCGANPPYDHPHVFIDMGSEDEAVCPYCSTLYKYNASLKDNETVPAGCQFNDAA